jgi:hypothetical protein
MGLYNTLRGVDVTSSGVMAGLVSIVKKDVDARDKPGHDVERFAFGH